jgi:hypothetical protein
MARICRCGAQLPRQNGPGRPRELCDACRHRRKVVVPDWAGDTVRAINLEFGPDNRSLYVHLARLAAAYLDGVPNTDTSGIVALSRLLDDAVARARRNSPGQDRLDTFDELAQRRQHGRPI